MFEKRTPIEKELLRIKKQEDRWKKEALQKNPSKWKEELEAKIPEKAVEGLKKAFCKGFSIVFEKGTSVIEKTYKKDEIKKDHQIQNYAYEVKGRRKELKKLRGTAEKSSKLNMMLTTVEGIGLGVLGIGLPDIVLFVGMILKGVYETALHYGFDYENEEEQYLILKMLEASLAKGEEWERLNREVDRMLVKPIVIVEGKSVAEQIEKTGEAFALDMLLLKFIQGLPIVGVIGGASNPIYYHKIMKYVKVKYQKRYLLQLKQ